jgi:Icc-related predicted phosphoesterase
VPSASEAGQLIIAAAGDVHADETNRGSLSRAFAALNGVDLVLLAGDLTTLGEPEQAAVLAAACAPVRSKVVAVLGNHDWHADRAREVTAVLERAGIRVLDPGWTTLTIRGVSVGLVGAKGFVGGFLDSELPDFGEPLLRALYAETTAEVEALDRGLEAVAGCDVRIVLLHYAPTLATIAGERQPIWPFLGSQRLAAPISRFRPDLVLHGHAHGGHLQGAIGDVPVLNVAVPVLGEEFALVDLQRSEKGWEIRCRRAAADGELWDALTRQRG